MGNLCSGKSSNNIEDFERSKRIDESIKAQNKQQKDEIMMIVLGTGESGKSTFVKQLQLLYKDGFDKVKRRLFKDAIQRNVVKHIRLLINAAMTLGLEFEKGNEELANELLESNIDKCDFSTIELKKTIKELWNDNALKKAFEERASFQIPDSSYIYLDDIDRISQQTYIPTDLDILGCRIPTTGIVELKFNIGNRPWNIIDVGGQRSERRKWIDQFQITDAMIYVVAINEYNQKLYEEETINRMDESLSLFETTANHDLLITKTCILFFNKIDLFKEKINKVPLINYFPNYQGKNNVEEASEFIADKFRQIVDTNERNVYDYFTVATETESIRVAFDDFRERILQIHLGELGVLN